MYPCCKMTPRLDGWWLVSEHDHCTCSPHMGAHEDGCGLTPEVKLDHLPGWDELVTAVTAIQQAEIDRLNATIQRVREILETSTPELPVERFDEGSVRLARDYARRIESALRALEGGEAS